MYYIGCLISLATKLFTRMKEKISAELVKKFPGLSKKFLGLLADKLATKVTEESQIEGALAELDNSPIPITDLATEFQKEGDRRVTDAEKEWKKKNPPKPEGKTEDPKSDDPPKNDDVPEWAKALLNEVKTLKREKVQGTMKEQLKAKLKDVPESYYAKRALPEKEEDLEAFAEEVKADYSAFEGELVEKGLMSTKRPVDGNGGPANTAAVDADIKEWANKGKPASTTT